MQNQVEETMEKRRFGMIKAEEGITSREEERQTGPKLKGIFRRTANQQPSHRSASRGRRILLASVTSQSTGPLERT
jgi:hypothetical protein